MSGQQINITLGTAGHIDHGKTALIKCLTGCETDRLRVEKERGMSIELGFAPCTVAGLEVGIVDVPGHENFVKTMVAGASGMDGVIFVVAADDGVMPQTREHFDILTLLGVKHGIVALTKIDRVDEDLIEMVSDEVREFLAGTFLGDAPIIPLSNVTGQGFDGFVEALTALVESIPPRDAEGVFRVPIERSFSVKGYGTVLSGIPVAGSAKVDDEVVLLPQGVTGRIKAIQVYGRDSNGVLAGQCAALNMRHWDHGIIERGNVVTLPGYFEPAEWVTCRLRLLDQERIALKSGGAVRFHTGTTDLPATIYPLSGSHVQGGEEVSVQFRLSKPIVVGPGDRFIVRTLSPVRTVGGGMIVATGDRRFKRNRPEVAEQVDRLADAVADSEDFVAYCVETADGGATGEAELSRQAKVLPTRLPAMLGQLTERGDVIELADGSWMHSKTADRLADRLTAVLTEFHERSPQSPGMAADELADACGLGRGVFDGLTAWLTGKGRLAVKAGRFALADHEETFSDADREHLDAAEALFVANVFKPPSDAEVAASLGVADAEARRLIQLLLEHDKLVRVGPELLFHREAIDKAREILVSYFRDETTLESVKFKYLLDTTRKFAIPLLDYFDRQGVTLRVGNTRYLKGAKRSG